jgi:(E)-4-hydroxy-3-methylbut-2-enyl-diphosphate synthase
MKIIRRKARIIKIGDLRIGGAHPVAIQSMVKCKTSHYEAVIAEINSLKKCGCEIVRLAVKDRDDAKALKKIKLDSELALVADIHFDWRLALEAIESGVDKIRLNPGNIYKKVEIVEIAKAAKAHHIPIRVGLNSGSLPDFQLRRSVHKTRRQVRSVVDRMCRGALDYISILEKSGFYDIVVSMKASNILDTIAAYRQISTACDYPMHLGLTATGLPLQGAVNSSMAIGALLLEGIGDTIRVSLTERPEVEVRVAKSILEALDLRHFGVKVISCPTCGRCEVNLIKIVSELENKLSALNPKLLTRPLKVAVMGCVVNGPGEAREADIGVAFGKKVGLLFRKGRPIKKIPFASCADILLKEVSR